MWLRVRFQHLNDLNGKWLNEWITPIACQYNIYGWNMCVVSLTISYEERTKNKTTVNTLKVESQNVILLHFKWTDLQLRYILRLHAKQIWAKTKSTTAKSIDANRITLTNINCIKLFALCFMHPHNKPKKKKKEWPYQHPFCIWLVSPGYIFCVVSHRSPIYMLRCLYIALRHSLALNKRHVRNVFRLL